MQLAGYDIDKNVITRIETQKRYITDIEIKAICELFNVSFEEITVQDKKRIPIDLRNPFFVILPLSFHS